MLSSFNLTEALAWLAQSTGRKWTDSELFDLCTQRRLPLHAAPPLGAQCVVVELNPDDPAGVRVAMRLGWRKAILHPWHVGQLWQVGETEPAPVFEQMHTEDAGRWAVFDPPVRVRREHLTIRLQTLQDIAEAWHNPSPVERSRRGRNDGTNIADAVKPKRTAQHRESILQALTSAGHTLPKLPPYRNGTTNEAKRAARDALVPKAMTIASFNLAWQELLDHGSIEQRAAIR